MTSASPARRVGIVAKSHLRAATTHLAEIVAWLDGHGLEPIFETATAALCALAGASKSPRTMDKTGLAKTADLIVVLGGDGTLLSMAAAIADAGADVPILGVNFGSLGFLTEVTLPELYTALDAAVRGNAPFESRLLLRS